MTNAARYEDLCYINFASQKGIDGISRFNSLTACETFEKWIKNNKDFDLKEILMTYQNSPSKELKQSIYKGR